MQAKFISLVKVPRSFKYTYKNRADIEETNTKKYVTEALN